jgi:hypothetical protein
VSLCVFRAPLQCEDVNATMVAQVMPLSNGVLLESAKPQAVLQLGRPCTAGHEGPTCMCVIRHAMFTICAARRQKKQPRAYWHIAACWRLRACSGTCGCVFAVSRLCLEGGCNAEDHASGAHRVPATAWTADCCNAPNSYMAGGVASSCLPKSLDVVVEVSTLHQVDSELNKDCCGSAVLPHLNNVRHRCPSAWQTL